MPSGAAGFGGFPQVAAQALRHILGRQRPEPRVRRDLFRLPHHHARGVAVAIDVGGAEGIDDRLQALQRVGALVGAGQVEQGQFVIFRREIGCVAPFSADEVAARDDQMNRDIERSDLAEQRAVHRLVARQRNGEEARTRHAAKAAMVRRASSAMLAEGSQPSAARREISTVNGLRKASVPSP